MFMPRHQNAGQSHNIPSKVYSHSQILSDGEIRENKIGGACSTYGVPNENGLEYTDADAVEY
jgi:hypothetical protein